MCGIAAIIGLNGAPAERYRIEAMTTSLFHRGPDEGGAYSDGSVAFGFRRLAILDLSPTARQPMVSEDGELVLVFNGEIFNYIELRQDLQARGYKFKSTGDTEVLLQSYREWGEGCLNKFNGMWAFLIYDRRRRKIFGSRDRFGVKPLYVYRTDKYVLFASEPKAIRASGFYSGGPNWAVASRFLLEGRLGEGNDTFYSGICGVSPAAFFEVDMQGSWTERRYWSVGNLPLSEVKDPATGYADLLEDSVRLRLRSDVPVGVSLSGGLDSTSILCAAARLKSSSQNAKREALMAFSYMSSEYDESPYIRATIEQAQAQLSTVCRTPVELWHNLETVLWYHDEPLHSMNALVGFEIMRLASANGTKVVLSGQGADETIAGYFSYFPSYWNTLFRTGRLREAWRQINAYSKAHGGHSWRLFLAGFRRLFQSELQRLSVYRQLAEWNHRTAARFSRWFTSGLSEQLQSGGSGYMDRTFDSILARAVEQRPLPLYLRIEDRNSMAHSIEVRLPFLDYRLVSLAFHLPAGWKMHGPWNKYILREAMHGRIPELVRTRTKKMGFPVPVNKWFANELYEPAQDFLSSRKLKERGIYQVSTIRKDLELHRQGKVDIAGHLFKLVQFELWRDMCFESQQRLSVGPAPSPMELHPATG